MSAIATSISLYKEEVVPSTQVGDLVWDEYGNTYRYAKVGASNLVLGNLLQSPINNTTDFDQLTTAAFSAGDTSITVTTGSTAVSANEFVGGTATISIAGGVLVGSYIIVGHAAAGTTSSLVLNLNRPLMVSGTSSQKTDLRRNPFNGVIQNPTTATGIPVGVAMFAASAGTYTWIQTGGVGAVLSDNTTLAVGNDVEASTTAAGAVTLAANTGARVGVAMKVKLSTGLVPVRLHLPV